MTPARTPSDSHQDAQDALVEDRSMRPPNAMGAAQMSASAPGDGHRVSGSEPEHQGRRVDPARADARVSPHRFRRDFHGRETQEEARDRNAAEDYEESGGLVAEGLANERRARPFLFVDSGATPTHDPRCFGRHDLDNPDSAA